MILNKNIPTNPSSPLQPNVDPKFTRRAAGAAAAVVLSTVGASMLPGPSHNSDPTRGHDTQTEEEAPATTIYEVQEGDDMTSITQRELDNSGIDPETVTDMNRYVDPNVELNGGNTAIIPGQKVTVIDIPNVYAQDLQNANNQPPVDQSKV